MVITAVRERSAPAAPQAQISTPRLACPPERRRTESPQTAAVQARVLRVFPAAEAQRTNERRDADDQLWWSERVRKITASIDQKLDRVVGAESTPVLQPRLVEVEVHVAPTRDGPPSGETVRSAAFDHQEGCNELRSSSPGRSIADDEIPSALTALKSIRQEIEVMRERQQSEARNTKVGIDSPFIGAALNLPFPPLRSRSRESHEVERGESVALPESLAPESLAEELDSSALLDSGMDPPVEPSPNLMLRQDQQELRIQALQAKVRHLEQQIGNELSRQLPPQELASPSTTPASPGHIDRLIETELGSLKQELKAQHMEHSLGVVQESNILRKDVSVALRNEREARCEEIRDLRSALEVVQDGLQREIHETMDLICSRLEQHLQAAVDPERIDEVVSKRLEMTRLLSKASDIQQGMSSAVEATAEIDIEREARCRSMIDLRMEMEGKLSEGIGRFESQCATFAEDLSALQETVAGLANNGQVGNGVSFGDYGGAFVGPDVQALAEQLEVERTTRVSAWKDLSERFDDLASRAGTGNAESLAMTVVENLKLVERHMQHIEKERANYSALSREVKDLQKHTGSELDDLRRKEEANAKAFELAVECEREARSSEISAIRTLVELGEKSRMESNNVPGGSDANERNKHLDGEIVTLYGMVKEALSDTVRLSVEIDAERKKRQKEIGEMRKLIGI